MVISCLSTDGLSFSITRRSIVGYSVLNAIANSWRRRRWTRFRLFLPLFDHLLTAIQHYNAKHRIKCPKCDLEFTTWANMYQVAFYPIIPDFVLVLMWPSSTTKQTIAFLNAPSAAANSIPRR